MIIVYCDKCGLRVSANDLGEGRAVEINPNCWLCGACAPVQQKQPAPPPRPKSAPTKIATGVRRGAGQPVEMTSNSRAPAVPQKNSTRLIAMTVGGMCFVIAGIVLVVANRSKASSELRARVDVKITTQLPKDGVTKTEIPKKINTVGSPEKNPAPVALVQPPVPAPVALAEPTRITRAQEADKEMENFRETRAAALLLEHKEWFKQNAADPWEYRTRLRNFAVSYRSTPAAAEANKLLEEFKSLPPQPDRLDTAAPEAKDYQLVYDLNLANISHEINYDVDNRSKIKQPFDRIAYFIELTPASGAAQYLYVSLDAFTDDLGKIGVPTPASGARFQQNVANMNVYSNVSGIVAGMGLNGGNMEFWPDNYGPQNAANVPGASNEKYDFGDQRTDPPDGYGCMQIHNHDATQTLFALNHWREGGNADLGIGNQPTANPDWTFSNNASGYHAKRLRVLVHLK